MTTETKWQPGPWRRDPKRFDDLVDANGVRVTFGRLVLSAGYTPGRAIVVEANTVLAESSTDLYAALSAALDGGVFKHPQIREAAEAALARARGEETP